MKAFLALLLVLSAGPLAANGLSYTDSDSINFSGAGSTASPFTGVVTIDPAATNILQVGVDGLAVNLAADNGLTIGNTGTAGTDPHVELGGTLHQNTVVLLDGNTVQFLDQSTGTNRVRVRPQDVQMFAQDGAGSQFNITVFDNGSMTAVGTEGDVVVTNQSTRLSHADSQQSMNMLDNGSMSIVTDGFMSFVDNLGNAAPILDSDNGADIMTMTTGGRLERTDRESVEAQRLLASPVDGATACFYSGQLFWVDAGTPELWGCRARSTDADVGPAGSVFVQIL